MLGAAMERVLALISTRRQRSPLEPPVHLTNGYARLIVANGFARLGDALRARAVRDEVVRELDAQLGDPLHQYLVSAYSARVEQACAGLARDVVLPAPVASLASSLAEHNMRYKANRLQEVSPTLATGVETGIAVSRPQASVAVVQVHPLLLRLRAIDPDFRGAAIDRALAADGLTDDTRLACLDALIEIDETDALLVLVPAVHSVLAGGNASAGFCAAALTVAARFGYGELVPSLMEPILATEPDLFDIVAPTVRALRRLGLTDEIRHLIERIPAPTLEIAKITLAAIETLVFPERSDRAAAIFETARRTRLLTSTAARSSGVRELAGAATHAELAFGLAQLEHLFPFYDHMTDSFGTNSHFCLTALDFIESLVLAITDMKLATLNPRAAADAPLLAWQYALQSRSDQTS
jgi:hypothetical protein